MIEAGSVASIIQMQANSLSKKSFVEAAVTLGVSPIRMVKSYYFPNLLPEIIVLFFFDLGRSALLIGKLGIFSIFISQEFVQLNYGSGEIINTNFNWATLLGEARKDLQQAYWIPFYSALTITFTIFSFNLLGEGLRRYFNRNGSVGL